MRDNTTSLYGNSEIITGINYDERIIKLYNKYL